MNNRSNIRLRGLLGAAAAAGGDRGRGACDLGGRPPRRRPSRDRRHDRVLRRGHRHAGDHAHERRRRHRDGQRPHQDQLRARGRRRRQRRRRAQSRPGRRSRRRRPEPRPAATTTGGPTAHITAATVASASTATAAAGAGTAAPEDLTAGSAVAEADLEITARRPRARGGRAALSARDGAATHPVEFGRHPSLGRRRPYTGVVTKESTTKIVETAAPCVGRFSMRTPDRRALVGLSAGRDGTPPSRRSCAATGPPSSPSPPPTAPRTPRTSSRRAS